jgi:hypothetical protein
MTPEDLQHQLLLTGISCRVQRDEVVLETCRFCGNTRWNLELNAHLGVFHCWACNAGGRLDALLRQWLNNQDIYIPVTHRPTKTAPKTAIYVESVPAYSVRSAASYLARRGIPAKVAEQYDLTVCIQPSHHLAGRLLLPVREFWTGVTVGYVGRSYTGQQPKYLTTFSAHVIGGYRVRSWETPCVLVEGIFDGIAVHRAGYHAAVLHGIAAPRIAEFAARLPPGVTTIILLDGSAREEAGRLHWRVRAVRPDALCHLIGLPAGRDPADFGPKVLKHLLDAQWREQLTDHSMTE